MTNRKIHEIPIVEQTWLYIYPMTTISTYNWGNESVGHAFDKNIIKNECSIRDTWETAGYPQANSILEQIQ